MMSMLAQVLVVLGALVFATAGLGLLTLRDAFARTSAIATAAGLGVTLILIGAFLTDPSVSRGIKLAIAALLQLCTSAIGSMAIARAAYLSGSPVELADEDADELARAEIDRR